MIFCMNMYLDNLTNPIGFQGQRWPPKLTKLFSWNVEKIVVDNAVFRLSVPWFVPEIFAIKVQSCPKSSALLITHEPLHLAWCNFARTCILTTSRALLNFKVIDQRSRSHGLLGVFCVHDTMATCGQYLALSKAWRSCSSYYWCKELTLLLFAHLQGPHSL